MKISKFSTVFLLTVLSSCLTYSIAYHYSYETVKQVSVCLIIKPGVLNAVVDINPDTLNVKSQGQWITAYIELPEGYNVEDIDVSTILLNDTIEVDLEASTQIGDYDGDDIEDLTVKFDRASVLEWLDSVDYGEDTGKSVEVTLTITGDVMGVEPSPFKGSDTAKVLFKG